MFIVFLWRFLLFCWFSLYLKLFNVIFNTIPIPLLNLHQVYCPMHLTIFFCRKQSVLEQIFTVLSFFFLNCCCCWCYRERQGFKVAVFYPQTMSTLLFLSVSWMWAEKPLPVSPSYLLLSKYRLWQTHGSETSNWKCICFGVFNLLYILINRIAIANYIIKFDLLKYLICIISQKFIIPLSNKLRPSETINKLLNS